MTTWLDAFLAALERHPVHIEAIGFHPFWPPKTTIPLTGREGKEVR
jgi:hypothetical protein